MARDAVDLRTCLLLVYIAERVLLRFASWVIDDQGKHFDPNFDDALRKHLTDAIPPYAKGGGKRRAAKQAAVADVRDFGLTLADVWSFFLPRKGDPPAPFGQRGPRAKASATAALGERWKLLGDQRNNLMHGRSITITQERLTELVTAVLKDVRDLVEARVEDAAHDDLFNAWRFCLLDERDFRDLVSSGAAAERKIGRTRFARRWSEEHGGFVFVTLEPQAFSTTEWKHLKIDWSIKAATWTEFSRLTGGRRPTVDRVGAGLVPGDPDDVLKTPFWRPARTVDKRVIIAPPRRAR